MIGAGPAFHPGFLIVAGAVALGVLGCLAALRAAGRTGAGWLMLPAAVSFAVAAGLALLLSPFDGAASSRRTAEARLAELAGHALAPGSLLACLASDAGDAVAEGCETRLFASPDTVAQAAAFVEAQLAILIAAGPPTPGEAPLLAGLRQQLAADRYGLAAHILMARHGCQEAACEAFGLIGDPSRLRANMASRRFPGLLGRHAAAWAVAAAKGPPGLTTAPPVPDLSSFGIPALGAAPAPEQGAAPEQGQAEAAAASAAAPHVDFPSAESIPPVSIMDAEPPVQPAPSAAGRAAAGAPGRKAAPPPRRAPEPASPASSSTGGGTSSKPLPLVPSRP